MERIAKFVARLTEPIINSKVGQTILTLLIFIGPLTFLPTLWQAWTNPNIDAFRTLTWPAMAAIDLAMFVSLCHKGENNMRVAMLVWTFMMGGVWLATLVR